MKEQVLSLGMSLTPVRGCWSRSGGARGCWRSTTVVAICAPGTTLTAWQGKHQLNSSLQHFQHGPTTNNQHPTTNNHQPTTINQQPSTKNKQLTINTNNQQRSMHFAHLEPRLVGKARQAPCPPTHLMFAFFLAQSNQHD